MLKGMKCELKEFNAYALHPAKFLLPAEGTDMHKWSVVACDQYMSQPEYWQKATATAASRPSTAICMHTPPMCSCARSKALS